MHWGLHEDPFGFCICMSATLPESENKTQRYHYWESLHPIFQQIYNICFKQNPDNEYPVPELRLFYYYC